MVPTSQKADARTISFVLTNDFTGEVTAVPLVIRPEDLTRNEPLLMSATPTFNGAWIDEFGPGIATIQISGTTGWRGGFDGDGEAAFQNLYYAVWKQWNADRADAVAAGHPADVVRLIFADALDDIVAVVVPGSFVLKRSKARPLLSMYQISMTVVSENLSSELIDPLDFSVQGPGALDALLAGVDSLLASIGEIEAFVLNASLLFDAAAWSVFGPFLGLTLDAFNAVMAVYRAAQGVVDAGVALYVSIASDLALCARNAIWAYIAVSSLPDEIAIQLSMAAGAFENIYCVLRNSFRSQKEYPDYSDLYGASVCSSTIGGSPLSPLSGVNTFDALLPASSSPISVEPKSHQSISALRMLDPVIHPPSAAQLLKSIRSVTNGVTLT